MTDIISRLRIKAGMIQMGERIAWGSDSDLMYEAADMIEQMLARQQAAITSAKQLTALLENVRSMHEICAEFIAADVFDQLRLAAPQAARQQAVPVALARFRDIADFTLREAGRHNKWQEREALAKEFLDFIDAPLSFRIVRADASGITETGLSFTSPERAAQHADDMNATKNNSLVIFKVLAGALHKPAEPVAYAAPQAEQQKPEFGAPYQGARQQAVPSELTEALRQYRHNDGSDGFVFGYDKAVTERYVASLLAAAPQAEQAVEPVKWFNGCNNSVPRALRHLASNDRPIGGESLFNSEHLLQLADEIELMARKPLYTAPPTPDVSGLVEALEQLLDCPYVIEQATIPKAGIEAAPQQVVGTLHVNLMRMRKARAALATHRSANHE